jgi:hypothetical protein
MSLFSSYVVSIVDFWLQGYLHKNISWFWCVSFISLTLMNDRTSVLFLFKSSATLNFVFLSLYRHDRCRVARIKMAIRLFRWSVPGIGRFVGAAIDDDAPDDPPSRLAWHIAGSAMQMMLSPSTHSPIHGHSCLNW